MVCLAHCNWLGAVDLLGMANSARSYSGRSRWLAELSLRVFGSYYEKPTFRVGLVLLSGTSILRASSQSGPSLP